MESWISQWERYFVIAPRFTEFFSTAQGRELIQTFPGPKVEAEVLAFLLIRVVWSQEKLAKMMSKPDREAMARNLANARRTLQQLHKTPMIGPTEEVTATIQRLEQWERQLKSMPLVSVGPGRWIGGEPPARGRHRAKRQVVFFMTRYFYERGIDPPPWSFITAFLCAARLVSAGTNPKTVATWWSNICSREVSSDNPIEPHQDSWLRLYAEEQRSVHDAAKQNKANSKTQV
jgi:hypothetical protein